jgi:signal peptidase I
VKKIKDFFNNPLFQMISKIISWTILSLLVLIAAFLIYYVISAKIYEAKGEKFEPQFSLYTIISKSMEPNILVYDVVFDTKVNKPSDIKVGDIITFVSTSSLTDGMTITHRVVGIIETADGLKFKTKGDNNLVPDSALADASHVIGKVAFKIPQLGRIQFLLQSKGGWLFALLIPALGVVIYDILKVVRLSMVKDKVNDALTPEERNQDLLQKEAMLKNKLQQKFVNVAPITPIMQPLETANEDEKILNSKNSNINNLAESMSNSSIDNNKLQAKTEVNQTSSKELLIKIKNKIATIYQAKLKANSIDNNKEKVALPSANQANIVPIKDANNIPVIPKNDVKSESSINLNEVMKNIAKLNTQEITVELPEENIELPKIKKN